MADQAAIQKYIQTAQGTHSAGQSTVPSSAQNGNPNGVYNFGTYTVGPDYQFNLTQRQVPASDPGYTPPFAADPYLAGVLSGMPQAQGNEHVDRILSRLFGSGGPIPGAPTGGSWGSNPSPGQPGPGTGQPSPGTGTPSPGAGAPVLDQIGPISGPIAQNPHNWSSNYNNAQPNTNLNDSGLGRTQALDWLRMRYQGSGNGFDGVIGGNGSSGEGQGIFSRIGQSIGNALGQLGIELGAEGRQFWQSLTGQNGVGPLLGTIADILGIPGASTLLNRMSGMSAEQRANLENTMQQQINQALSSMNADMRARAAAQIDAAIRDAGTSAALDVIQQRLGGGREPISYEESRRRAQEFYDSMPEMSAAEWRRTQDSMAWNNLWYGRDSAAGNRNPVTGLPAVDNMDAMINNISRNAVNWDAQMRNRWTRER